VRKENGVLRSTLNNKMMLAVDWDAKRLRVVHAGLRKGKVRVERMLSVDIPPEVDMSEPESAGKLLREVLAKLKIRTKRVILDVPRDQALLTTLNLPAASPDDMPALVEFQIAKELPFPLAEAVVDFALPDIPAGAAKVDVLVGTVRREVVAYYQKTCAAADLTLARLGLRPQANKVAVSEFLGPRRDGCHVLVDVGPRLTEIDVIIDGTLAFSRAASVVIGPMTPLGDDASPPAEGADAGEATRSGSSIIQFPGSAPGGGSGIGDPVARVVESLVVEVTRSVAAFRAQTQGRAIDSLVVAGDVGIESRLAEILGKRLEVAAELYNPARQFGWPEDRGREGRAFAAALGLVQGHAEEGRLHFDFLNPKRTVTVVQRRLRKAPAVAAVVALFTIAGVWMYMTTVVPKKEELAKVRTEIRDLEKEIKDLNLYRQRVIEPVEHFERDQIVWIDELDRLAGLMPSNQEAVLTRLDLFQGGGRINIPLSCKRMEVAQEAIARIDAFRLPDDMEQYFDATAKRFSTRGDGAYPSSGAIEVVVKGKSAADG
jgi:type IV pilus assembly protein PilM